MGRVESTAVDTNVLKPKKKTTVKYRNESNKVEYDNLYIDQNSGIFYARKFIKGKNYFLSLRTKSLMEAKGKLLNVLSESSNTKLRPNEYKIFADYFKMVYNDKVAKGRSPGTLKVFERTYRIGLRDFWQYVKPVDINQDLVSRYFIWYKRKFPGQTMFNQVKYLSNVLDFMVKDGSLLANKRPELGLTRDDQQKYDKQKGRYITTSEFQTMLKFCDDRLRLILVIAFTTGMRKGEICSLKTSDIRLNNDHYVIKLETDSTKTGRAREIPLIPQLTPILDLWLKAKGQYVFPSPADHARASYGQIIDRDWGRVKAQAGIGGKMRFHDLRHTAATNMAKQNINPSIACAVLGMSLRVYQKVYLRLTSDDLAVATNALGQLLVGNGNK